jgi:hypothetical protein
MEEENLQSEILKTVEGMLPRLNERIISSYVLILVISLLICIIPLLTYSLL